MNVYVCILYDVWMCVCSHVFHFCKIHILWIWKYTCVNLLESSWNGWLSKSFIIRLQPFKINIRYNDCECGDTTSGEMLSSAACLQRTKSCHFVRKHILSRCCLSRANPWAVTARPMYAKHRNMKTIKPLFVCYIIFYRILQITISQHRAI